MLAIAATLPAANISFGTDPTSISASGAFETDADVQLFALSLTSSATVSLSTTSWISGFAPNLTLFYGDGTSSGVSDGGNYNASLTPHLTAGDWLIALTQYPNVSLGDLSDGFQFSSANFTSEILAYGDSGPFWDSSNVQHSGTWSLSGTLTYDAQASEAPEPATFVLLFSALAGVFALRYRANSNSSSASVSRK
jgi:hypothetical protein